MKLGLRTLIVLLAPVVGTEGCGSTSAESASSIGPSRFPTSPQAQLMRVSGSVQDTAGRPLSGAHVAILDSGERLARRRGAVLTTTTGSDGRYLLTGPFNSSETVRAVKEGYLTATQTIMCAVNCWAERSFFLEGMSASIDLAGDYALTITADSTCPDLPGVAHARTYTASMTPTTTNSRYHVQLGGAVLSDEFPSGFNAGVAGDYFSFPMIWNDPVYADALPGVVEEIGPNTYVAFSGVATATVTSAASAISAAFDGWITYCALKSPLVSGYVFQCDVPSLRADPTPSRPVTYARCASRNHRMVLTRR